MTRHNPRKPRHGYRRTRRDHTLTPPAAPAWPDVHVDPHLLPVAMFQPGTVLLAKVHFGKRTQFKVRPVVVLSFDQATDTLTARPVTTSPIRHAWRSWEIQDLTAAGLVKACGVRTEVIRLHRRTHIHTVLGHLAETDWEAVQQLPRHLKRARVQRPQPLEIQRALENTQRPTLDQARALLGLTEATLSELADARARRATTPAPTLAHAS